MDQQTQVKLLNRHGILKRWEMPEIPDNSTFAQVLQKMLNYGFLVANLWTFISIVPALGR